ncbi:MAG: ABC transporter permease [Marinibacterium sp.]|nr:ABC transporter permease [Marinibacterium sp.]
MIRIEPRTRAPGLWAAVPPVLAVLATILASTVILNILGVPPLDALHYLYVAPFSSRFNFAEVLLKMAPLLIIAQALAIGFRARIWNIGAEGQLILGAIGGSLLPVAFNDSVNPLMLPAMAAIGMVFGMGWAAIAAWLRTRFNANEILVTLMLNSIALQLLYYLVSGPLRDPYGYNFPQSALFPDVAMLPTLISGTRANSALIVALAATLLAWGLTQRSFVGFRLRVGGLAPGAARYAGFSEHRAIWMALLIGGGAAGLAGVFEVAGPLGQLQRVVTPGYGFAAIIVAFLGGLNPVGILAASFFMAVIYVGGDVAQTAAGVPHTVNLVLQGVLLVTYVAARVFTDYQVTWSQRAKA